MAKEAIFAYAKFDLAALLRLAETLRQESCSCELSERPLAGSLNWVVTLNFEDGVEWVFRSPRSDSGVGVEYSSRLLGSEAATLKYIKGHTSIPVPDVIDYSTSAENPIGVPYILMSKAQGTPLSEYHWPWFTGISPPKRSIGQTRRPLDEIAKGELAHKLSQLRLEKIGSIFEDDAGGYVVRECLGPSLVWQERDVLDICRGPFDQDLTYYASLTSATRTHAQELPMRTHMFLGPIPVPSEYSRWGGYDSACKRWNDFVAVSAKIDSGKNRLDYYIASDMAKDMMTQTFAEATEAPEGFPIRHPDLSTNSIFVDDDLNITCIIDWGFASSAPLAELLACPGMPHPRCRPDSPLITAFRSGFEEQSGYKMDPQFWYNTEIVWYFQRLVSMDSLQDYHYFEKLYKLVNKPDEPVNIATLIRNKHASEPYEKELAFFCEDDQPAADIDRREREYFSSPMHLETDEEAVARKLTVMAELNPVMVADRRLWHWIVKALERRGGSGSG